MELKRLASRVCGKVKDKKQKRDERKLEEEKPYRYSQKREQS